MSKFQKTEKMLLNIPASDMEKIEMLLLSGRYSTKSEIVRSALKEFLYSEERMKSFNELSNEVQKRIKELGLTRKDINKMIEDVKEETRKEVGKMMKEKGVESNSSKKTAKQKR